MAKARAEIEIIASSNRLASGLSSATRQINQWSAARARGIGNAFRNATSGLGGIGGLRGIGSVAGGVFGGNLLTRVLDTLTAGAGDVMDSETELLRLGISAKRGGFALQALRDSFRETSMATGINSGQIVKAARTYFDLTSDADGLAESMRHLAVIAQASGSDIGDVTAAYAALRNHVGVMPHEMKRVFGAFIEQGNEGQIGIRDLASELVNLLPQFKRFGVAGSDGAIQLNAAFQVVARSFGSASEAATGLENMMAMLQARQKQLAAAGVKVYEDKDGVVQMRRLDEILGDIRKKLPDVRKHGAILGDNMQGRRALDALREAPDLFDKIVAAGENAGDAVDRDFGTATESSVVRLEMAINKVKESIADAFTPERIETFVDGVEAIADAVGRTIDGLQEIKDWATAKGERLRNPYAIGGTTGFGDKLTTLDVGNIALGAMFGDQQMMFGQATREEDQLKALAAQPGPDGAAAREHLARRAAFDAAMSRIEGASSRSKRIRAAVAESEAVALRPDLPAGYRGGVEAGQKYLVEEMRYGRVSEDEIARVKAELQAEQGTAIAQALAATLPRIADEIARGFDRASSKQTTQVQIDGNNVATAVKRSTNTRSGR